MMFVTRRKKEEEDVCNGREKQEIEERGWRRETMNR